MEPIAMSTREDTDCVWNPRKTGIQRNAKKIDINDKILCIFQEAITPRAGHEWVSISKDSHDRQRRRQACIAFAKTKCGYGDKTELEPSTKTNAEHSLKDIIKQLK